MSYENGLVEVEFVMVGCVLLMIAVFLHGCTTTVNDSSVTEQGYDFTVNAVAEGCSFDQSPGTTFRLLDDQLMINDTVPYVCCANITVNYTVVNDALYITEVNRGEVCKCPCNYNVNIWIKGRFPRHIVLSGVEYHDPINGVEMKPSVRMNLTIPSENVPVELCKQLCYLALSNNRELANGPCLSNDFYPDYVCDVAHDPRQPIDNRPENQCSFYRMGIAHHFVEVTPECKFIRAH